MEILVEHVAPRQAIPDDIEVIKEVCSTPPSPCNHMGFLLLQAQTKPRSFLSICGDNKAPGTAIIR
jgi:hypothetical protein